jgi:hypothetical protein
VDVKFFRYACFGTGFHRIYIVTNDEPTLLPRKFEDYVVVGCRQPSLNNCGDFDCGSAPSECAYDASAQVLIG